MSKQRVLLVDDDERLAEVLSFSIEQQGREVVTAAGVDVALTTLKVEGPFDAIITDLRMPGRGGMELVKEVCAQPAHPPIIVLTAYGSVDAAVDAMKAGAADFLAKPVSRDVLRLTLDRVLRSADLGRENEVLRHEVKKLSSPSDIIGRSKVMQDVLELIDRVAQSHASVLIRGESGTGKELVARRLHKGSPRHAKAFVAVNCAALPRDLLESELFGHAKGAFTGASSARRGRFVEADGGTLFLDEIGDLDLDLQAKLLRVLQDGTVDVVGGAPRKVDVRIVTATHQDLEAMVRAGAFRQDLYFRIRVVPVELPPLRARGSDIGLLFASFVGQAAAAAQQDPPAITPELLAALSERAWPGNVRELENVATRMTVTAPPSSPLTADQLLPSDGQLDLRPASSLSRHSPLAHGEVEISEDVLPLQQVERALVVAALSKAKGNRTHAARSLAVPRHYLLYRIEKYRITDEEVRELQGANRAPIAPLPETADE